MCIRDRLGTADTLTSLSTRLSTVNANLACLQTSVDNVVSYDDPSKSAITLGGAGVMTPAPPRVIADFDGSSYDTTLSTEVCRQARFALTVLRRVDSDVRVSAVPSLSLIHIGSCRRS
ncbi:hypothetical protein [Burkholderia pseudomallei]|uniref:hypothetical protein n=1 Tax=Burkholderia pseudomallei TaxID=28450 RepID=UPI0011AF66DD|nr:hypothetical protein [Burkholderia pseudomallei]